VISRAQGSGCTCAVCGKDIRSKLVQCGGCNGWIHRCCLSLNGSLSTNVDAFVCKACERVCDGEDINIQEIIDLRNIVCLDRVGFGSG